MLTRPSEKRRGITFHFAPPAEIPHDTLSQIERLVREGRAVGSSFVGENLRNAFLVAFATDSHGRVIGTVTLKRQKDEYRKKLESATGLDLTGYLERGYTSVAESWRGCGIAGELLAGLIRNSSDQKAYVTIRMDNAPALRLTRKNGMVLAARFLNKKTGREIGLFVNR